MNRLSCLLLSTLLIAKVTKRLWMNCKKRDEKYYILTKKRPLKIRLLLWKSVFSCRKLN